MKTTELVWRSLPAFWPEQNAYPAQARKCELRRFSDSTCKLNGLPFAFNTGPVQCKNK